MIAVALKGLAGRKVRALLTALAVVIGISMVSGTYILTDTMQKSFDGLFTATYDKTDAVISTKEIVKDSTSGHVTIPAALLGKVRDLPEVKAASGSVTPDETDAADIIGGNGKKVARESVGGSVDLDHPEFSPLRLKSGKWAQGPDQVVVDAGTVSKQHYKLGDPITVSSFGVKHTYRLTGVVSYGDVDSLGFASIAAWDLETAQKVLRREDGFDSISLAAAKGVTAAELVRAVKPLVPATLEVKDSEKQAADDADELNSSMSILKYFLLGFGALSLLVGAFVIFNTLSITVAQRTREFATLRTLGGSRKQVMRSVIAEGFVIGLLASVLGLLAGIGLAKGLVALFAALGVELPEAATVIAPRTIILSIVLGTVVTVVASILPARRATRVPPIAAVREGATLPQSKFAPHAFKAGLGVVALATAAVAGGLFGGLSVGAGAGLLGGGVLLLFAGMALLAPRLVVPLARFVGGPARARGAAGELAGANAVRNPGRTASTAAALMIGITLVTLVATVGGSFGKSTTAAIKDEVHADYVLDTPEGLPFRADGADKVAAVAGVTGASHVRSDRALVNGKERTVTGVDPATIGRFYRFKWQAGSLAKLGDDGAIVSNGYADEQHLVLGKSLALTLPTGEKRTLVVRGIHKAKTELIGDVTMTVAAFDSGFTTPKNSLTFLAAPKSAGGAIKRATADIGGAKFHVGSAFAKDSAAGMASMLAMLYVLLGFSVLVSLFGMVNTLVLSVFERTREIGMLRAIGMSPKQARRMIRHESIITALIGAALGLGLGTALAALVMFKWHLAFAIPFTSLIGFTLVAVLAGVAAAVMPARRASRLNVLTALQYE
ncbi:ABC transporter permease [Solirubrobacter ginsenosidimutans]|uniref:ABC transporter permease n=1 Tax=Solirubrobacter ginsenosidimutans TaxID=490573 RepID=A0A9X3MVL4_9ACTN|nr:ABC transporter permease [Solirubrobacter ginsenosidimutans]MDA0163464.1 ABC transporter permease [Solirubrobacter ginsenosidimutans]